MSSGSEYEITFGTRGFPPIALLPGLFAGGWIWESTRSFLLGAGYSVVSFHKPLVVVPGDMTLDGLRNYFTNVFDDLELDSLLLCGNSLGGLIALDFAADHPDRVIAAIASGAPGMGEQSSLAMPTARKLTRSYAEELASALFFDRSKISSEMIDTTYELVNEKRHLLNVIKALRMTRTYDMTMVLPRVECEVALIWGDHDTVTPFANWKQHTHLLRHAEWCEIPNSGHSPMLEQPNEFNAVVEKFIKSLERAPLNGSSEPHSS